MKTPFRDVCSKIHDLVFGKWYDKPTTQVLVFHEPGVYLLAASAFGACGVLGGKHTWLVHVDQSLEHSVLEVTDKETLMVQGANKRLPLWLPRDDKERLPYISDRDGGQLWFGARPYVLWHMGSSMTVDAFMSLAVSYPELRKPFNTLTRNCNTFSSWVMFRLQTMYPQYAPIDIEYPMFVGSRSVDHWAQHVANKPKSV